jgi:hypothetical protein
MSCWSGRFMFALAGCRHGALHTLGDTGPTRDIAPPSAGRRQLHVLRRIAPSGHVSCSFLPLLLKKELEERIADLGRNGS